MQLEEYPTELFKMTSVPFECCLADWFLPFYVNYIPSVNVDLPEKLSQAQPEKNLVLIYFYLLKFMDGSKCTFFY